MIRSVVQSVIRDVGLDIGIPFGTGGGVAIDWVAYWASLISATVENAAPTHVVLTFPIAQTSLVASDFTIAGFTVNSASWGGTVLTLVLSTAVIYGDSLTVTFVKTGGTKVVTNNVLELPVYVSSAIANATPALLEMTYNLTLANIEPATSAFAVLVNAGARTVNSVAISGVKVQLTLASGVNFGDVVTVAYTKPGSNQLQTVAGGQAASITAQSVTNNVISWVIPITGQTTGEATAGTMVISCTEDITITKTGDVTIEVAQAADDIYRRHTVTINCPNNGSGTVVIPDRTKVVSLGNHGGASDPTTSFYIGTNTTAPKLTWNLNNIPATCLKIRQGVGYTVILPATGNTAFPTGLTFLFLLGNTLAWTYNGALPTGLSYLSLSSDILAWTYNGALPTGLTYLNLNGVAINWTGLDISGTGNITIFNLPNYRVAKMSSADMVTLLTNLTNRVGGLPATVIINDYADYASPPQEVTDAVTALKAAKSITTVDLGA